MNAGNKIIALLTIEEKGYPVKAVRFYLKTRPARFDSCSTTCSQKLNGNTYNLTLMVENSRGVIKESIKKPPLIFIKTPLGKEVSRKKLANFLKFMISEKKIKKELQEHIECFVKEACGSF